MKRGGVVVIFLYLFLVRLWALDGLRIENITSEEGLSQNTVRHIMQDSRGFMWIGTMNGLNRYDGKKFIVMKPKSGYSVGLQDNRIQNVTEDKNGYCWVRTYSGMIGCYDRSLERFVDSEQSVVEFKDYESFRIVSNGDVWIWGKQAGLCRIRYSQGRLQSKVFKEEIRTTIHFVYEDQNHSIWIGTEKGVARTSNDKIIHCNIGEKEANVTNVTENESQLLFFTHENKMLVFDKQDKTFRFQQKIRSWEEAHLQINSVQTLPSGETLILTEKEVFVYETGKQPRLTENLFRGKAPQNAYAIRDNKDNLWLYNGTGVIWQYDTESHSFRSMELIPPHVLSLIDFERFAVYHDSRNIIWITTYGNGLFALDCNTGQLNHFTSGFDQENRLHTNYLLTITEDKSGEIWIGCEYSGIIKISLTNYKTKVVYPESRVDDLNNNAIRFIQECDDEIWLGSRRGHIYVYDQDMNKKRTYTMPGGIAYCMAEDTAGNKWIGTKGSGLLVFPAESKKDFSMYTARTNDPDALTSNNIYSILKDSKGRMWLGTFGAGIQLVENKNEKLIFHKFLNVSYNQSIIRCLMQDKEGLIWTGTNEGVCVFDPEELMKDKDHYVTFYFDTKNEGSISNNEVKCIFEDSKGNIWFGTSGGGINRLLRGETLEQSTFQHYTSNNGLSNDVVQALLEDDNGCLWISTESGISKFDPEEEHFETFNFSDVRQANLFCEASCWKRSNGDLMFGSYNGMYVFNPQEFMNSSYIPKVLVTNLMVNGNPVAPGDKDIALEKSISQTKDIRLRYDQNSFSLEFSMLNFHRSSSNRYTYILEGYEKEWNPISEYNVATYKNIPTGKYTFKVKGCNSFGVWNEEETILTISIVPPFWKSNQALVLYLLLIMVIFFFVFRTIYKLNKLNNEVKVEKQLSEYKIRFFTNISHEFRTPLTIIQGAIDNLTDRSDLPEVAMNQVRLLGKSSRRLMRLIDQLLEFRRLQNNKMELRLERTEVISFFHEIYKMFTETAEKKNIQFLFNTNLSNWEILMDKSKMDKIAYNLLSNAFKNTPEKGTVVMRVFVDQESDRLELSVKDSGVGIPKDQREFLFTRFKQISYSSAGTGIGLHLTAELVSVHKGEISYSDSDMGGACFSVFIPLSEKNYREDEMVRNLYQEQTPDLLPVRDNVDIKGIIGSKSLKEYHLLIMEDDNEVREFLKGELEVYFTVSTAENGLIGLDIAEKLQPDLIVCDVMMPEMNGFEVTRRLRANFEISHVPIILLTAHSSQEHQLEALDAGADSYIIKPFNMKYLMLRIIKLIDQREHLQHRFAKEPGLLTPTICSTERDTELLEKMNKIIEENLGNPDFSVESFAQTLGLGRTVFFRKVKALMGYSPNEYIRVIRLKKAAELLSTTTMNVGEVAYAIGMNDPFYFSKSFKAQFGKAPSVYQKEQAQLLADSKSAKKT